MVTKSTPKKKPVAKKTPVKKAESTLKTAAPKKTEKRNYEMSTFFHALVVTIVVLLYAEIAFLTVLYFNYDISIESKQSVEARQINARYQQNIKIRRDKITKAQMPTKRQVPVTKCPMPVARKMAFNPAEYAPYDGQGASVIAGKACFELKDGSEKCFPNIEVFINPVTTYSEEWYNRGWAGKEYLERADKRAFEYNKKVRTGQDGRFEFKSLKPGSYYVGTSVCLPEARDSKKCSFARFASKVTMKNRVNTTLKKVAP